MLVLFDRLKEVTGKKTIAEVWPDLRLVIHGGTKFDPYRDLFKKEIGSDAVKFCEVYPCSEGFIATEDPRYGHLRVVPDHDVFFEFVPVEELGKDRPDAAHARRRRGRRAVRGRHHVVRRACGRTSSATRSRSSSRNPPLIRFTGRTKYFLSAFGEHLISEEVEKAVAHAARVCGVHATRLPRRPGLPGRPGQAGPPPVPDRVRRRVART